jgi:hypothetical protein
MAQIIETIAICLIFILFIALIIGMIKPRLFLRYDTLFNFNKNMNMEKNYLHNGT